MTATSPKAKGKSAEQQGFEAIGRFTDVGGKPFRPFMDRLFSKRVTSAHLNRDWASDADWARMQQDPIRARLFLYTILLAFGALIAWAYFASIDEVTRGTGRVIPSSQLQKVQSFDGGVVQQIMVREGEMVEAGQVLMRIDPTRFVANFRENRAQALALRARAERLRALVTDTPFNPDDELRSGAPEIVAQEREVYESRREELREQESILRDRIRQREEELNEAKARRDTAQREANMASQELNLTRPLLASGAVSEVDILRLEREVSRATGERNQAAAAVARLEAAVEEARTQLREIGAERRSEWRNDLAQTIGDLGALDESSAGLQDRVRLAEVRSPVDGIVQRLGINTLGGVVQPGQEVVDIIPSDDQLLVEARIAPQDIAFLRPGQPATIKLTAYDFAIYGGLEAELDHISADTITDDDDNTFYLVRVKTVEGENLGSDIQVIPGMTAQVDIMTGKRTVMQYLLKPVLRAWSNSMGER
ncbi:HlyD family type I secretion periplasmic adaptor subunit [Halomonas sp. MCCC 1A17488]|uniref:Membrane fusion protein (MFP) family protein n=1 Tax=Billgrantia sulfidoxydans TaxID=2733484 RepID=A0ABX7W4H2_9GAMM|nr:MULTISPECIES: HlyD family type I secretion periplasmic adaptor subunit [Halomonas]MCE8014916.1 HlyD family type I secretion periplasmic adaptor subunit [Halomonas sp. MCCC 1A17488]MCG3238249.1 HlyD family type I secretion periplasmic adaptor subunit [Halomonas sp. MCCC 1A17488]QPP47988.1 HlyD family type I secretion periplasmic adaptor subunit [Halomonas sp. SS10-MC5]QTP55298.1 HlyD family type I secretion periplasmic adaptor subunit [Halomonas sulfidoxydans]